MAFKTAFKKQAKKQVKQQVKNEGAITLVKKKQTQSKIAKGRMKYFLVYSGRRQKTSGGLTTECIRINKRGRYVSLKKMEHGQRIYDNIKAWNLAFMDARTQVECCGFVAINGKTLMGQALYIRTKKLHVNREAAKKDEAKAEQSTTETMGDAAPGMAEPVSSTAPATPTMTVPESDVVLAASE